jgi:hypothetical protein
MWTIPLAHGALGGWDELIPVIIVGIFTVIMIVAGLISRRNDQTTEEKSSTGNAADTAEKPDTHYHLD